MKSSLAKLIATFFYFGYFPIAPGTIGSLVGVLIYYIIYNNIFLYIGVTALFIIIGFLFSGQAELAFNKKDSPFIIIDEVGGMLLSLAAMPFKARELFLAFFLFRLFDTLKIPPANSLQRIRGSLGIMADDIMAAIYTILTLQFVLRVLP